MPRRLSRILGFVFGASVALYVGLVVFTISLASWQTSLASQIGDQEAAIGTLESRYYASVTALNSIDPATLGFVTPKDKVYAHGASAPVLTRAGF